MANALPEGIHLESLDVGATPLIEQFLRRLNLAELFERFLPTKPGRQPQLPSARTLCVLVTNLLLARQPLYALPAWAARRVPEHLGLQPDQVALLNDDRIGRALDHFHRADRASLLTALVTQAVRAFEIDLSELHQDTTTVTFSGQYEQSTPGEAPHITFGYNKDHRPDLKQLLYAVTISSDGAVPIHCKLWDGNTSDDSVHIETWDFLRQIVGHPKFLYVADSKLCSRDNMGHVHERGGTFLTVMPRTRREDAWFREYQFHNVLDWVEVHRQPNPRSLKGPEVVYHAVESPERCTEGYRILWYRSSQKQGLDQQIRQQRLDRAAARLAAHQGPGRRPLRKHAVAQALAERILREEQVADLLGIAIETKTEFEFRASQPGRPTETTEYRRIENVTYRIRFVRNEEAIRRQASRDGLFPLMTNDPDLSLADALGKYKYQPFVEKRHQQLKSIFGVMPMWLKNVKRISSLLWLYYAVELVGALIEREIRRRMEQEEYGSLALYPEGRASESPTAALVMNILEGHRRHRLLDDAGGELKRFHDPLPDAAKETLELLQVDLGAYGIESSA